MLTCLLGYKYMLQNIRIQLFHFLQNYPLDMKTVGCSNIFFTTYTISVKITNIQNVIIHVGIPRLIEMNKGVGWGGIGAKIVCLRSIYGYVK